MDVAIVGSGYVGLVTGVGLAKLGHRVQCVERDVDRVARINRGDTPIHEEGLADLLAATLADGSFVATTSLADAVAVSEVTMLAVGTPSDHGRIDLRDVLGACRQVGQALPTERRAVVIVKSTVVPGTTDTSVRQALEEASGLVAGQGFGLAVNPEFLTEGRAVADFMEPDRIVIGADDEASMTVVRRLYAAFPSTPIVAVTTRNAEMIKYASNAMLATAISFSNELANLAEAIGGVDMLEVMAGLHSSRYLTGRASSGEQVTAELAAFFLPGCGFGGSCLPKDVSALVAAGAELGERMPLLEAVLEVNRERADRVMRILEAELGNLRGREIGVLGLAFKPDTSDVRESPAFPLIRQLLAAHAAVTAHDPVVTASVLAGAEVDGARFNADLGDVIRRVDAAVLVTSWREYLQLPQLLGAMDDPPLLVDGRRALASASVPNYRGIGLA
jgi:UDPglucose 6-dehydrogenase